jgi:stage V sporulation protein G
LNITEVRIKLIDNSADRLRAFCSITFDYGFVVRDLKIIEGEDGLFVAMPSRKLMSHCPNCKTKNHLKANYCNQCGKTLNPDAIVINIEGRCKLYADIAHPVNRACRELIQKRVIEEFQAELERSRLPGYNPSPYNDIDYDADYTSNFNSHHEVTEAPKSTTSQEREDARAKPSQGPHREREERHESTKRSGEEFGKGILD